MYGTDLFQAYEQTMPVQQNMAMHQLANDAIEQQPMQPAIEVEQVAQQQMPSQMPTRDGFFAENNLQEQLQQLQKELHNQKRLQKQDNLLDRFVSKKKDVMKLVLMSMTILLAFSMHYIIIDLIKNYSMTNELSSSKELFVKLAYPLSVLMGIWTMKVLNQSK